MESSLAGASRCGDWHDADQPADGATIPYRKTARRAPELRNFLENSRLLTFLVISLAIVIFYNQLLQWRHPELAHRKIAPTPLTTPSQEPAADTAASTAGSTVTNVVPGAAGNEQRIACADNYDHNSIVQGAVDCARGSARESHAQGLSAERQARQSAVPGDRRRRPTAAGTGNRTAAPGPRTTAT